MLPLFFFQPWNHNTKYKTDFYITYYILGNFHKTNWCLLFHVDKFGGYPHESVQRFWLGCSLFLKWPKLIIKNRSLLVEKLARMDEGTGLRTLVSNIYPKFWDLIFLSSLFWISFVLYVWKKFRGTHFTPKVVKYGFEIQLLFQTQK